MSVRSVAVRYSASVSSLVTDLGRAAKANDQVGTAAEKAAKRAERASQRQAKAARDAAKAAKDAADKAATAVAEAAVRQDAASQRSADRAVRDAQRAATAQVRAAERATDAQQAAAQARTAVAQEAADKEAAAAERSANLRAGAAAAVALGLSAAVSKFAEFDQQMSSVAAVTNQSGDALNSLRDAAITAGAATQYSATEAATAITELSKAGLEATDILGGGLTGALNLAAAGQMDVGDAAETMATALAQFKLPGEQASHVADLLAAGAGKAQGSVADMGMALKQSGLVAKNTGLSIDETAAALTAMANAGLIGSDAGTSLKTMLQRLTPQSDQAAGMMDELGISAYDASGKFIGLSKFAENLKQSMQDLTPEQRNAAMAVIFGSDAVRGATVLYNEGSAGIDKWTKATGEQGYAARQASTMTDNLRGDIERLGGSLDTALIQGGSGANNVLRNLTQTAEGLVNGLGAIPGPILTGAAAFGIMALAGPRIAMLGKTLSGPFASGAAKARLETARLRSAIVPFGPQLQGAATQTLTASQRITTGLGGIGKAVGGLKGAAGGLMGALGGPWGLALTGATIAIGMWAQGQAAAKAAGDALNATVDAQTGKFTTASRDTAIAAMMGDLSPADVKLLQDLGVNFTELADDMLKGGPAAEAARQKLVGLMDEHQSGLGVLSQEGRATEGLLRSFDRQAEGAEGVRIKQEALTAARNNDQVAASRQAGSAASAERNTSDLGVAVDGVAGSAAGAVGPIDDMGNALDTTGGKAKDAKDELQGMLDNFDLLAGGQRALAAADRGINDAKDAAIKAARDRGGNDPAAVKAQKSAKAANDKAQAELADALAGRGSKGGSKASASANLSLKQAREHQARILADAKSSASARESAANRVAKAELRVSQAQGKSSGSTKDIAALRERAANTADALADANKRVADSFVTPQKAQEAYVAAQGDLAEKGEVKMESLMKQTKPLSEVKAAYDKTRAAILEAAKARGINGKALDAEADKYLPTKAKLQDLLDTYEKTPAYQATQIITPGLPEAKKAVEGYWTVVDGFPKFIKTEASADTTTATSTVHDYWEVVDGVPQIIHTEVEATTETATDKMARFSRMRWETGVSAVVVKSTADAAEARLDQLARNRQVNLQVTANYVSLPGAKPAGNVNPLLLNPVNRAGGGAVFGPGTTTSDSIPALLSNEEHVLTAEDVRLAGGHGSVYAWRQGLRNRYATGGAVDVLGSRPAPLRSRIGSGAVQGFAGGGAVRPAVQASIDHRALVAALSALPRSGDHIELHGHGADTGAGLRAAVRDLFWERDHRRE